MKNPMIGIIDTLAKDDRLLQLTICVESLQDQDSPPFSESIDAETLQAFRKGIQELIDILLNSNIQRSLKDSLWKKLNDLQNTVEIVLLVGIEGVEDKLESLIGSVAVRQDQIRQVKGENADFIGRVAEFSKSGAQWTQSMAQNWQQRD